MKISMLIFIIVIPFFGLSQEIGGIHFEHGISWQQIMDKAKQQQKLIFVDCYTSWCGPCKQMSNEIFPQKQAGEFYNAHYVNWKLQMDTTKNDDDEIKNQYATSHEFYKNFGINAYPTFLILSGDGQLLHKIVGSMELDEFVKKGKEALIPENQYYFNLKKYQDGDRSPALLSRLANLSYDANDFKNMRKIIPEYLKTQNDFYTKHNLELLIANTNSSADTGFKMMYHNPEKVDQTMGKNRAEDIVKSIIFQEEARPIIVKNRTAKPDWKKINSALHSKYPERCKELLGFSKSNYFKQKRDWKPYLKATRKYVSQNYPSISPSGKNIIANDFFRHANSKKYLKSALSWSKENMDAAAQGKDLPIYMTTYSNLLYKLGRTSEAIDWAKKSAAIALKNWGEKDWGSLLIEKMEKGEKTW